MNYSITRKYLLLILLIFACSVLFCGEPDPQPGDEAHQIVEKIGPLAMEAVLVRGGTFEMGDKFNSGGSDEQPVHEVKVTDFYMGTTEVTVGQYKRYCLDTGRAMPEQESYSKNDYPMVFVTWFEAQAFCEWAGGSLPTEAQWEYAASSRGMMLKYPTGSTIDQSAANFSGTGKRDRWKKLAPVAKFPPNLLGIYDIAGNVYEWCYDYYKSDYYKLPTYQNPRGPATSMFKVLRGGSWYHGKEELRCSDRFRYMPVARVSFVGFRVAWDARTAPIKGNSINP